MASIGYHLVFRVQIGQLKSAMKRNLRQKTNRKDVVEFAFDQEEVQQIRWEDEAEFSWKGEMYDVVEKREVQGKLYVVCIADKLEKKLLAAYQRSMEHKESPAKTVWIKLMTSHFTIIAGLLLLPDLVILIRRFPQWISRICLRVNAIFTPPPEVCYALFF